MFRVPGAGGEICNISYFISGSQSPFIIHNAIEMITIPTKDIPIVQTNQMIDLGLVFKSGCVVEAIESLLRKHGETI